MTGVQTCALPIYQVNVLRHLSEHTEVQNIDLMNLAGFCRNCLSKWYPAEAGDRGFDLSDPQAREIIYGMPYEEWKAAYQTDAKQDLKDQPQ